MSAFVFYGFLQKQVIYVKILVAACQPVTQGLFNILNGVALGVQLEVVVFKWLSNLMKIRKLRGWG